MALPATDQDVANMALAEYLGHTVQITTLASDDTTEARNARLFLDSERDLCLAEYDWEFARKRAVLVEATGTGDWWNDVEDDWDHVYTPPTNCVVPRAVYPGIRNPGPDDAVPFEWRRNAADTGFVICCDEDPVTTGDDKAPILIYTHRTSTVTEYPQGFVHFFAASLAVRLAVPVMGIEKGKVAREDARQARLLNLITAARQDKMQTKRDPKPMSPSLAARGASSRYGGR